MANSWKKSPWALNLLGFALLYGWVIYLLWGAEKDRNTLILITVTLGAISLSLLFNWRVLPVVLIAPIVSIVVYVGALTPSISVGITISNERGDAVTVLLTDLTSGKVAHVSLSTGETKNLILRKGEKPEDINQGLFLILALAGNGQIVFQEAIPAQDMIGGKRVVLSEGRPGLGGGPGGDAR